MADDDGDGGDDRGRDDAVTIPGGDPLGDKPGGAGGVEASHRQPGHGDSDDEHGGDFGNLSVGHLIHALSPIYLVFLSLPAILAFVGAHVDGFSD